MMSRILAAALALWFSFVRVGGPLRRALLLAAALAASPAAADTVISGKSAQALRCAAYIGMAAQYGYAEGAISRGDRSRMTYWSVLVLERWVPLAPEARLAAYRSAIAELDGRSGTLARLHRHAEWCIETFRPAL